MKVEKLRVGVYRGESQLVREPDWGVGGLIYEHQDGLHGSLRWMFGDDASGDET